MIGTWDDSPEVGNLPDRRRELARLCRRKELRTAEFSPERPTKWSPETVKNVETDMVFTGPGAWEFVAQCLDDGCPIQEIGLEKPPGKTGYVLIVEIGLDRPLYIKLQLGGGGMVVGRSFHLSEDRHEA